MRSFAEIIAKDRRALHRLGEHDVDLVRSSTAPHHAGGFTVEALLTAAEVDRLQAAGYEVRVVEPAEARAHTETATSGAWLAAIADEQAVPGYLTADGIDAALRHLVTAYPGLCHPVELPEPSAEGRTVRALRIGKHARGEGVPAVFFLGGVHARELVNPDLLACFAIRLCRAVEAGRGLSFGERHTSAAEVRRLVEDLSIYLLPLANPDGRAWVQAPHGDPMWRKNRRPNPDAPRCTGVDVNRNFDFLWSAGLTASARPCSQTFKGPAPFSEPETRNVRHLVDAHPDIRLFVDLHSYSQTVFYPWGDDPDQTEDPSMCFDNPAFDGMRGEPHDPRYREYIPPEDLHFYQTTAGHVVDAINAARGGHYKAKQSVGLYPASGCSDDSTYARSLRGGRHKVMAFTVETATRFQPRWPTADHVITEVSTGLVAFCQAALALVGVDRA